MSKTFRALKKAEEEKQSVRLDVTLPARRLTPSTLVGEPPTISPRVLQECVRLEHKIQMIRPDQEMRVLVFLSSVHGEGTSRLATSYAVAMAQNRKRRVLLMDFNFASPHVHNLFSLREDEGLTDALTEGGGLQTIVKDTQLDNLKVATAGTRALLHGKSVDREVLDKLIDAARESFDTVILDAPPVLPCPEFAALGEYADGSVFVIRAGRTRKQVALRAKAIMEQARNNLLGVVMNRQRFYIPQFIYKRL